MFPTIITNASWFAGFIVVTIATVSSIWLLAILFSVFIKKEKRIVGKAVFVYSCHYIIAIVHQTQEEKIIQR